MVKEISEELERQNGAICVSCGAIFKECKTICQSCPNCRRNPTGKGLFWITPSHNWLPTHLYKKRASGE